jgi:hypothetical protein
VGSHAAAVAPVEDEQPRTRFGVSPGVIVLGIFVVTLVVIMAGVLLNRRADGDVGLVTIQQLLGDPDRYDNDSVVVEGRVEGKRSIPYLSQYALYTIRDETGSVMVLSQKGAPPDDGELVRLRGVFHSRVTLDDELKRLVEEELGSLVGSIVGALLPDVPLNVVFVEHESYELPATNDGAGSPAPSN